MTLSARPSPWAHAGAGKPIMRRIVRITLIFAMLHLPRSRGMQEPRRRDMYRFIHTCAARTGADKVADVDAETREYFEALRGAIDTIQGEIITMRDEMGSTRGEMSSMRGEMSAIRGGMAAGFVAVDQRFEAFVAKIDHTAADTRRH